MGPEVIALAAAAALLAYAIFSARQPALIVAVTAYAAVVSWIIHRDLTMLMTALGLAIVLGVTGLAVVIYREVAIQDDTIHNTSRRMRTNRRALSENIGS
jgi:hypothetical protein